MIADTDKTSAISQSAGTLTINGSRYLVTEDTAITLVTVGDLGDDRDASIMNKDEDAPTMRWPPISPPRSWWMR